MNSDANGGGLLPDDAVLERLYSDAIWGEGPVWLTDEGALRWSDIPNDRILQWSATTGQTVVHRTGVEFTNGRTLDLEGRIVQCSHGRRSIEYEIDGEPQTIVDHFGEHRLNSPNDIVVASNGAIWFTDPPYGIFEEREGHPGEMEYGGCFVFRYEPWSSRLEPVITNRLRPNGLAFSPDESILYVADSAIESPAIWSYAIADGVVAEARFFARPEPGLPDGFAIDAAGRLWTSAEDAVHVYSPAGDELLAIPVPEKISNLCFGGDDGQDLFITASSGLYRIRTLTTGAPRPAGTPV